jgi:hypothetical protein
MEDVSIHILWQFVIFYINLVYFVAIWYILWSLGIFFPVLYVATRKIWQPCANITVEIPTYKDIFQVYIKVMLNFLFFNSHFVLQMPHRLQGCQIFLDA